MVTPPHRPHGSVIGRLGRSRKEENQGTWRRPQATDAVVGEKLHGQPGGHVGPRVIAGASQNRVDRMRASSGLTLTRSPACESTIDWRRGVTVRPWCEGASDPAEQGHSTATSVVAVGLAHSFWQLASARLLSEAQNVMLPLAERPTSTHLERDRRTRANRGRTASRHPTRSDLRDTHATSRRA